MDQRVVSYLLGELPEAEQVRLEEEYFADEEKFQQLQAAQNDLLDAYARGLLTPAQREQFERHFLDSPWRRGRLELAQALTEYVDSAFPEQPAAVSQAVAKRHAWWQSLTDFLFPPTLLWRLAAVSAALLLLLGGVWLTAEISRERKELAQLRAEQATGEQRTAQQQAQITHERSRADQLARELEQERQHREELEGQLSRLRQPPISEQGPALLAFVLTPQVLRERGGLKRIALKPGVKTVELRLSFDSRAAYQSYRAELQTAEGKAVASWDHLRAGRTATGQMLRVKLPATTLEADDYLLKLGGLAANGEYEELANYGFRVSKQ